MAIEESAQQGPPLFVSVRKPASSLNTLTDPQDIADQECSDCLNMVFDNGYPKPRAGSFLAFDIPTSETNSLLNTINAVTSDGKEYVVAIYAPNFYVRDEVNNQWVKINGSYTPSVNNILFNYGYAVWNAGVRNDRLYMGNGTDDDVKWVIALDYISVSTTPTDTSITLSSTSQFPTTGGSIIIKGNSGEFTVAYTSISGNVMTLSGAIGQTVPAGSAVAASIQDMSAMPKGKLFAKFQGRLFIGNAKGTETTFFYSIVGDPETYTIGSTPSSGGFYGFTQGIGQLTGMFDFGQYLGVLKEDSMHRFEFVIDSTNTTKIDQVTPLVSDNAMGCPYPTTWVKKNNTLYYPSLNAGIFSISPVVTGYQTTIQLNILSQKIQNLYQSLSFTKGKAVGFQTKIFFSAATQTAIDTVLVYDTMLQYWTRFNNWAVKDWIVHTPLGGSQQNLYFGSYQDNKVYVCFDPSNTDNNTPYTSYIYTKRYDFGQPSMPKTVSKIFVQGNILPSTNLYCDVMFNEQGQQQTITYLIAGNNPTAVQPILKSLGMIIFGLAISGTEDLQSLNGIGNFKVYLNVPLRYGFYNIQLKFYTTTLSSLWSVTGIGFNPRVETIAPAQLSIEPGGAVPGINTGVGKQS